MEIEGKAAVVTGGAKGVGRATALARRGCHVLVNYSRSEAEAEQTAAEISEQGFDCSINTSSSHASG